jgi:hypothetical protein
MTLKIKLDVFVVIWNQMQNQTTPEVHLAILRWLENSYETGETQLLLMAFRACGKSTLVGIFAAWLIYKNPNLRVLIMGAEDNLAKKMVRNIRRILERHPLTSGLIPKVVDQWASDRFTVVRSQELRDPSVMARGLFSNITGARSDIIIYDDVEVPNTSGTKEAREELRHRLDESRFILTPRGMQLYVGTPHCYDTIYAVDQAQKNLDQSDPYLDEFQDFRIPIYNENYESAWPDKFSKADIESLKRQVGPNKFESQMMLCPVNIAQGRLNPELLQFYNDDLDYKEVNRKPLLYLSGKQIVSCSAWWDPSFGSAGGDASVLAVIFTDEDGKNYIHHIEYIRVDEANKDDEATQQCQKIASVLAQYYVPCVTVETNGIGKFLPAILRREIRASSHYASVIDHHTHVNKSQKIIEGFDAVMAAQNLYVHEDISKTPFLNEMREWRPSVSNAKDDGLDAVASALLQEPIRIAGGSQKGIRKNWSPTTQIFKAKT